MSIVQKINDAYIAAVKAKDTQRRDTLKLVKGGLIMLEKAGSKQPTEAEYINVLNKLVKTLIDAAENYPQMTEDNLAEVAIIKEFLPEALNKFKIGLLITEVCSEPGFEAIKKNMGKIVKEVKDRSQGRADGKIISDLVKKLVQ